MSNPPIGRRAMRKLLRWTGLPGERFVLGQSCYIGDAELFPKDNRSLLRVADGVELQDTYFNIQAPIVIEEGVVFGHGVMLANGMHDVGPDGVDIGTQNMGPIVIRKRAWIASRALILGGVEIGTGAVVAAGSVVAKSVPAHELWAGNPAQFVRDLREQPLRAQNRGVATWDDFPELERP